MKLSSKTFILLSLLTTAQTASAFVNGSAGGHSSVGAVVRSNGDICTGFKIHAKYVVTTADCAAGAISFLHGSDLHAKFTWVENHIGQDVCSTGGGSGTTCSSASSLYLSTSMSSGPTQNFGILKLASSTGGSSIELSQDLPSSSATGYGYGYTNNTIHGFQQNLAMSRTSSTGVYYNYYDFWNGTPEQYDEGALMVNGGKAVGVVQLPYGDAKVGPTAALFYDATLHTLKDNLISHTSSQQGTMTWSGVPGNYYGNAAIKVSYNFADSLQTQFGNGGMIKLTADVKLDGDVVAPGVDLGTSTNLVETNRVYSLPLAMPLSRTGLNNAQIHVIVSATYYRDYNGYENNESLYTDDTEIDIDFHRVK